MGKEKSAVPDIFEIVRGPLGPLGIHLWRVSAWHKESPEGSQYKWTFCLRDDATHVTITQLTSTVVPIGDVERTGRHDRGNLEFERDLAKALVGQYLQTIIR